MTIKNANYMYTIYNSASESQKGYRVVSAIVKFIQYCSALMQQASGTVTQQNAHYIHIQYLCHAKVISGSA